MECFLKEVKGRLSNTIVKCVWITSCRWPKESSRNFADSPAQISMALYLAKLQFVFMHKQTVDTGCYI